MRDLFLLSLLLSSAALAAPPSFTQQGRLFDASGVPLTGTHDLHFGLWDAPSGGQAAWAEDQLAVSFDGGFYAVDLGQVQPLQLSTFELDDLWLSVAVDGGPALPTRLPLASVPYALTAQQLRGGSVDATEIRVGGTLVIDADGTLGWASVRGAPQVLGALGCADGQLARAASSGWVCADASDHTHTLGTLPGTLTAAQASQLQPADIGAASSADVSAASAQAAADVATARTDASSALSAHAAQPAAHHSRYTNTEAVAAVKAGVTLADLQAGTVKLAVDTSPTCTTAGLLRYNAGVEYCDGLAWQALANAPASGSGTTADSAATSCKTLLTKFPGTPSGTYWIEPTDSGDPALAWRTACDMTLDGGGWTLVAYAGDSSAGFPRMDINAGAWDPGARGGKASRGAVAVAKVSSELALAYHTSTNFSGNVGDTTDTVAFTIPNPSAVTFTTSANAGSCVPVTARRLRPSASNAACVGSSGNVADRTSTDAAVNCNPTSGVSTAGVWTQSLGGTYSGVFAYGLYTTQYICNSWPDISHHWWVDSSYHNWEPSATQYWPGAVSGSTAIWLR